LVKLKSTASTELLQVWYAGRDGDEKLQGVIGDGNFYHTLLGKMM
jgi:hypothetical protein